ncbi:hypothetical protein, partial [Geobacillus thermoleovorans]|uniref:hypothetical protein n=1 Tax=Geobacillus thermoleovorans TaxID=33941 RepID=UPI00272EB021
FCMTFAFFYRASLGGPDERREQKFATLVGESFLNVTHKYFTHTPVFVFQQNNDNYFYINEKPPAACLCRERSNLFMTHLREKQHVADRR